MIKRRGWPESGLPFAIVHILIGVTCVMLATVRLMTFLVMRFAELSMASCVLLYYFNNVYWLSYHFSFIHSMNCTE